MTAERHARRRFVIRLSPGAEWLFGILLAVLDAVLLNLVFRGVFKYWLYEIAGRMIYINAYFDVRWYLFGIFVAFGIMFDVFRIRSLTAASDVFSHTAATLLSSFVAFNLMISMYRPMATLAYTFPRPVILFTTAIGIAVLFVSRILLLRWYRPLPLLRRAVIIGDEEEGRRIVRHFHRRGGVRYRIISTFTRDQVRELAAEVVFRNIHEVLVTDAHIRLDAFWAEIFYHRKTEPHPFLVRISYDPTTAAGTAGLQSLEDLPLITVSSLPLTRTQRAVKRAFDIGFALFAIVITSPLMLLTAILMRLDSPGPVFYRQKRVGRYGREYLDPEPCDRQLQRRHHRADADRVLADWQLDAWRRQRRGDCLRRRQQGRPDRDRGRRCCHDGQSRSAQRGRGVPRDQHRQRGPGLPADAGQHSLGCLTIAST